MCLLSECGRGCRRVSDACWYVVSLVAACWWCRQCLPGRNAESSVSSERELPVAGLDPRCDMVLLVLHPLSASDEMVTEKSSHVMAGGQPAIPSCSSFRSCPRVARSLTGGWVWPLSQSVSVFTIYMEQSEI